jgi:hypothetical protein
MRSQSIMRSHYDPCQNEHRRDAISENRNLSIYISPPHQCRWVTLYVVHNEVKGFRCLSFAGPHVLSTFTFFTFRREFSSHLLTKRTPCMSPCRPHLRPKLHLSKKRKPVHPPLPCLGLSLNPPPSATVSTDSSKATKQRLISRSISSHSETTAYHNT